MRQTIQFIFDRLAIGASLLCALHCAFFPLLLVAFPTLLALPVDDEQFHLLLLWFVIPSSLIAIFLGCRRHKDPLVLVFGLIGLSLMIFAAFLGHDLLGEMGEKWMTVIGAILLAAAHWRNFSLCRKDDCQDQH